jgi:branched-chain amino acid transport system substrate-binding protein
VAVAKLLPELKIAMMSVGSTGDWEAAVGDFNDWTFRSTRVDTYLIRPLLETAKERFDVESVAIISTADDDWSASDLRVYRRVISELGMTLMADELQMTGDTDRSAQLTKIVAENPDGLIINTLSSDAPTIAGEARKRGFKGRFLGTAGFTNPDTWPLAGGGVLDGTLVAENFYPDSPRRAVRDFAERYRAKFGKEPVPYAAYAFDGLMLVAEACRRSDDPRNRSEVRRQLGEIQGFEGVLGVLSYNGKGDALKEPVILQIERGGYSLVNL